MIRYTLKKLWPSLAIIAGISLLLIITDTKKEKNGTTERQKKVALFKLSSRQTLDDTERGFTDGLAEKGFRDGESISLIRYNAENDLPTAYTIASAIINQNFDMVITASTPALQVMANANKKGNLIHLFGAVTDPFASGVGLDRNNQHQRPGWLAGVGTFQPVRKAFLIAREMNPRLKKVGVVWCTGETCSEACVRIARHVCDSLGINLMESTIDNSSAVYESAKSLVARGAEALWIGGDNTVEIAAGMVIKAGKEGNIPVFTNNTDHPKLGALFGVGANYHQVGITVGHMAAAILTGSQPEEFPVQNVVPEKLIVNGEKAARFRSSNWQITDNIHQEAFQILQTPSN